MCMKIFLEEKIIVKKFDAVKITSKRGLQVIALRGIL